MAVTWAGALARRLERQLLERREPVSVVDVVNRLGAVPAWPDATAELTVAARRRDGRSGDVARALEAGELLKAYTFRGATHLMTPEAAGDYLALRASSRMWELPSWVSYYGLAPGDWREFRAYVRTALADGPLTRSELVAAFGRSRRYRHLRDHVNDGSDTLLKPLSWQGDLALGRTAAGETTFLLPDSMRGFAGLPDVDEAGPRVIAAHVRAYGPVSAERIAHWLGTGLGARKKAILRWLDGLGGELVEISVGVDPALVLRSDLDDLEAARPSTAVRLLPGRDPWVMGPGTDDADVVPPARREAVSRSANVVLAGDVVAGTWAVRRDHLRVTWFGETGDLPRAALDAEAVRLSAFLERPLRLGIDAG